MKTIALWACLLSAAAGISWAADVPETIEAGFKAFIDGRLEDAASAYRYLAALGIGGYESDANLALIARDAADASGALALWVKASLQPDADGFVWNQRGWAYLAENRPKEARDSFLKAVDRSSTTATQAEANLGLGLAAIIRSEPKNGMAPLRNALVQGPYLVPAASFETALTALALGDKQAALAYLRQALDLDSFHLESLRELAKLYEQIGENRAAWRAYSRLVALDAADQESARKVKKLAEFIPGNPETSMSIRRLTRPLLNPETDPRAASPSTSSGTIRVALFSDFEGKPATLTQSYFIVNVPFRIVAANGEVVKEDGRPFDQWEVIYRSENNLIEVRDASRNIQYTSKTPFRVVPSGPGGSVLLKSARFIETSGFDRGDREMRGHVEVIPTPEGFKAVNEVPVEDYLLGAVGAALPQGSPLEAYKAQAVVSRSLALWYRSTGGRLNMERSDICDSRKCQRYTGVNDEMRDASKGVLATEGLVLTRGGLLEQALQHEHCGGRTENGSATGESSLKSLVSSLDGPGPSGAATPLALERELHSYPARERYCEAGTQTAQSESRWLRLLDAKSLQARADRAHNVGTIEHIRAKRRSQTGRVRALEVIGSRGSFVLEGDRAIGEFLSPGSLRSMLFSIQSLKRSSGPVRWIIWGAGTGHGLGMCRAGAIGQATLGRDMKEILSVYFPGTVVDDLNPKKREKPAAAAPAAGRRKPMNPRFKR